MIFAGFNSQIKLNPKQRGRSNPWKTRKSKISPMIFIIILSTRRYKIHRKIRYDPTRKEKNVQGGASPPLSARASSALRLPLSQLPTTSPSNTKLLIGVPSIPLQPHCIGCPCFSAGCASHSQKPLRTKKKKTRDTLFDFLLFSSSL